MSAELLRVEDWPSGDVECLDCGALLHLYFNGGELDHRQCCGLTYETEHVRVDLVVTEP